MQTKKQSFIESLLNVTVGFLITIISLHLIFPLLGMGNHSGKKRVDHTVFNHFEHFKKLCSKAVL